ncbi:unnamed protein product (macronuclear) [Paramecium tetraurelia]|uniref:Uncharacterized protein n=1 Tax=Paramecium tetraurelia TaxID=5888 RepID=A0DQG9_PARTE|nr:uncharacterized protein GSPATT00002686001 [Paramecium tetraurelia]CAK85286.1 unnamed protein product [Paramecium tetraurelia]|eukprot:XP_001452683.1 hypothetical protein (macronuclear) [Paramecium tetraurelia strain d4-2]
MIFLIDSKSILDCRTYSIIRPHQFDVVAILEYYKQQLQSAEFKEESKPILFDKLKTLANVLFNSNKSQILRLLQVFTQNSSENQQLFQTFQTSTCSQWFIEQLYIDLVLIIFQQYLLNDQQFIGVLLKKIMNLYELNLQVQSGQYKSPRFQEHHQSNMNKRTQGKNGKDQIIDQFKVQIDDCIRENNYMQVLNDVQYETQYVETNTHPTKTTQKKQSKKQNQGKQKKQNLNQEPNLIQSNPACFNQQGQGSSGLEIQKQQNQINDLICNIISKKSIDSENLTEEYPQQKEQKKKQDTSLTQEDPKKKEEINQVKNDVKKEIQDQNNNLDINTMQIYQLPENEQENIVIQQYTTLEGVYELLEDQYSFDIWWPVFKAQCVQCKNKDEFFKVLQQKAPILMEKWSKTTENSDSEIIERFEEIDLKKQDNEQQNDCLILKEQDRNNILEKSANLENNNKNICTNIVSQQHENIDKLKINQQIQSQGNQTESNHLQSSQQFINQEFIQENRFSQDFSDGGLFNLNQQQNFENQNFSDLFVLSPSKKSSANYCSDEENFVLNKGNEEENNSNLSQSDSVILDEKQTKKSLITNLEQFYKSKLVENQPQHIFPELEYMGDTQKMVEKLLSYLDLENLDIQIEDFLAQPPISPSKNLQEFVLATYNIIKHITIHKYSTIIEVKQVEKEYLGSVIICQVNNNNKEIKKYKGPCLDIVNIITRLIAIKKLNNKFFSEGLESTSLFQSVMSIIKRLVPGKGVFKEIKEKYKKIKSPHDKHLDKIVLIKAQKSIPLVSTNQQNSQPDKSENKKYDLNKQPAAKRRNYDKRGQRDGQLQNRNTETNFVKNKKAKYNQTQNQNESNTIFQQHQNNYEKQDYSFDQSPYSYNQQNQSQYQSYLQNQYQQPSLQKKSYNYQNQLCQQGYQGTSKNQQQEYNFYQQSAQNQYAYNTPYHPNHLQQFQYQAQYQYDNQNDMHMQAYPYFLKKSQTMQKGNFKLEKQSRQQLQTQQSYSHNRQSNQYEQFHQNQQMTQSYEGYAKQKQRRYDYQHQSASQSPVYQNQGQFNQENQYLNQPSYYQMQPQNNQRPIDCQIIQKMVTKLMGDRMH